MLATTRRALGIALLYLNGTACHMKSEADYVEKSFAVSLPYLNGTFCTMDNTEIGG